MSTPYTAVKVEGALLSGDLMERIAAGDRGLPGFRPEDYHLAAGERLGDAASRKWEYLVGVYRAFQDRLQKLPRTDSATTETRERWVLLLLDELGFGRVPFVRGGLAVDGKSFALSHLWQHVPIHLVGWHTRLDHRSGGGETGRAPQSMLQELLNVSDDHLWGVLSNGRQLRILRDSSTLVGSAYVEFDLEAIFDGDLYSDFLLLFALLHVSRTELLSPEEGEPTPADCWLERWRSHDIETGARVREQLRDGVEKAINELGSGFLGANPSLRDALGSGALTLDDFHHELLRLAYQLIFLFVAEDRGALHGQGASTDVRERYARYFSTARLRRIAGRRRGDRHTDLWRTLVIVLEALGSDDGLASLGLPGLGGLYFRAGRPNGDGEIAPDLLRDCELANSALLAAMRSLSEFRDTRGRRHRVDYQHLGAEELGSVYESLLELVPRRPSADEFRLEPLPGNERKTTGSYYTPSSLVELLLDSALDPVIDEHAASGVPSDLLKITVCDPASGSGHFLVAAARRIAKRYAAMQTGENEPTPEAARSAMRMVVERCIYGVDVNPLAAELAKVSLWLESLVPGRPLAFLDHHIKVGNSLLGVTPSLLERGIPDDAYRPIEGDDRKVAASMRRYNAKERRGQDTLFAEPTVRVGNAELAHQVGMLAAAPTASLADVREQARRLRELESSPAVRHQKTVANAWCAAFVWRKHADAPEGITSDTLRRLDAGVTLPDDDAAAELERLTDQYRFFHWHLEFPGVFLVEDDEDPDHNPDTGWEGGFSCVLGNPPWERVKLAEKEFFASRHEGIATAPNKAARDKLIKLLATTEEGRALHQEFTAARRKADAESHLLRASGRYPLGGRGDVNTYAVFAEGDRSLLHPRGRLGVIVPTGIATDATTQYFFKDLLERRSLVSLYDFENARGIFPAVHRSYKFCLLTVAGSRAKVDRADFAFFLHDAAQLADEGKRFTLTPDEISLLNPNTGTCPVFRSRRDAEITLGIYRRVPVLVKEGDPNGNPWGVSFMTMFHMSNDSHLFHTRDELEADGWHLDGNIFINANARMLPLYEAKMLHHYDHRWATYERHGSIRDVTLAEKQDPNFVVMPRYWVPENNVNGKFAKFSQPLSELLGYRWVARSTDERTFICGMFPRAGAGNSLPLVLGTEPSRPLLGCLASLVLDYVGRQKLGGANMTFGVAEQLAVLQPEIMRDPALWKVDQTLGNWISDRVIELTFTALDLPASALDDRLDMQFGWDEERRALLRAELDAAFFHLYGIDREDVDYILGTFPIVKRKDEAQYGEYRTKRLVLEIYDSMADAIRTSRPYGTILDPPPGQGARRPDRVGR